MAMKITIVTACWNSIATIRDAIDSVKAQKLPPGVELEHLIIDGGSTDGTEKLATISEPDNGLYDAINKGIRMSTGEVIGILNSDDVLANDRVIAEIAQQFESSAERLDCVYGNIRFVNELGGRVVRQYFVKPWKPWMLQWGYMPPHPGVYIRRECFERWGGYVGDRNVYRIAADCELLIRYFRVHRMRSKYCGICTTTMRTGGLSTSGIGALLQLNREIIKANRANGYFCCWPMLLPKYLMKVWEVIWPRLRKVEVKAG